MGSTSLVCDLLATLSVKYQVGKDQDPVKMLEDSMLFALCFYKNFSETTFIVPKIAFIKNINFI